MSATTAQSFKRLSTYCMELQVQSNRHIWEIQQDFNKGFEYLKLEFFSKPHSANQPSPVKKMVSNQSYIKDLVKAPINSTVAIDENMSVTSLEKLFRDELGLSIQVFRKSGNIWLETTMTDSWTLKQQNDHGKEITVGAPKSAPTVGPEEYDAL